MKLGQAALEALREQVSGLLSEDQEIVVVGAIGLDAMKNLLTGERERLEERFSSVFLWHADKLRSSCAITEPVRESQLWKLAEQKGASGRIEVGEEGFLASLWKIAEASGVGMHIDLRKIPVRQETIEICEEFDINPYEAACGGAFIAGFANAYGFLEECGRLGIPAAVIGLTNGENARLLYSGEGFRYLDRPRKKADSL